MSQPPFHPEDKARVAIDQSLAACGWIVQYKAEMNLGAGPGVAVREFQTASGPVDYALFVGRKLCGVVEATRAERYETLTEDFSYAPSQLDRTVLVPKRHLTYAAVEDLRDALKQPPWLLEPVGLWRAYKRLAGDKVRGNAAGTLADIVMLARYALQQTETLEPLSSLAAGRFNLWLGREEKAGRIYSDDQKAWLMAICDHLAVIIEITPEDLTDSPEFSAKGGILRVRNLFGAGLPDMLEDLTEALVA